MYIINIVICQKNNHIIKYYPHIIIIDDVPNCTKYKSKKL